MLSNKSLRDPDSSHAPSFVYGATDGTVTTFAIISGVMGAALSPAVVLLLGVSNVLADGFSMAASAYLSKSTEHAIKDADGSADTESAAAHGAESATKPLGIAVATFTSFVLVGFVPLVPFVLALFVPIATQTQFDLSIGATALAFAVIGAFRGIVGGTSIWRGMAETIAVGGLAAIIAFSVGYFLKDVVPGGY
jgi:VIT1/CCC1 family predicted Fe2+/Mn2+ transporter